MKSIMPTERRITTYLVTKAWLNNPFLWKHVKDLIEKGPLAKAWCHTWYLETKNKVEYMENVMPTKHRIITHLVTKAYETNFFEWKHVKHRIGMDRLQMRMATRYI